MGGLLNLMGALWRELTRLPPWHPYEIAETYRRAQVAEQLANEREANARLRDALGDAGKAIAKWEGIANHKALHDAYAHELFKRCLY